MLFQTSLGIDIQDNSISLAYLKASFNDARLAVHAAYPLEGGVPLKEKVDLIAGLAKDFLEKNSISPASLFLGIPRETAILRYLELPLAVKENLTDSIGYEMEKYVPFPADETYFDYQVIEEDKENGKLRIFLIAAKKESVEPYLAFADQIGIGISGIEIGSTAIANYFLSQRDSDAEDTYAIVYLRYGHVELNLLRAGFLDYSRSIDRGERETDLNDFIYNELRKLKEGLGEGRDRLETIVCGQESDAAFMESLRGEEDLHISGVDLSKAGLPSSKWIVAYGLALKGIRKLPMEINLMPYKLRKRPGKVGVYMMLVLAGLLTLSVLAWGGGSILSEYLYLGRLNAGIDRLRVEVSNTEKTAKKYKRVEEKINYLRTIYGSEPSALSMLKEITKRIPKSAWVRILTFSDKGVRIDGYADSSSELIPSFESSPLFKDVAFVAPITRDRRKNKEVFSIKFKLQ